MASAAASRQVGRNLQNVKNKKVDWLSWKQRFQQKYARCAIPYVDSHCHLDFLFDRSGFKGSYSRFMSMNEETYPSNYAGCLAVFCEPKSFTPEGGLWKDLLREPTVWGALGCHPKCISDFSDEAFENLKECMKNPKVMALGEIGLDYSREFHKQSGIQKRGFIRQLELAVALNKPLVIHCRDAEPDCFAIMKQYVPQNYLIHRHCFTSDWTEAQRWLNYFPNLYIGLTPLVSYRSAKEVHEVARNIPLERLLLETDSPYFVPHRVVPRDEMKLSHPGMAITVADEVAKLRMNDIETVLQHCRQNTRKMYKI